MKESAGAANITVITVILIGVVAAVGLMIVPRLMKGGSKEACCTDAAGVWQNNSCSAAPDVEFDESAYEKCTKDLKN